MPITHTLSGVISGTSGFPFDFNVYTVSGDLTIPAGETLTLESGTTLAFEPGAVMTVAGKLIANGTPVYPVRLINDSDGWGGLRFLPSSAGSVCYGCLMQNIEPWGTAVQVDAPVTIAHSTLRGGSDRSATAITALVPFTLTNTIIDYFRVGLDATVPATTPFTVSHLTLIRNQTAVENIVRNRATTVNEPIWALTATLPGLRNARRESKWRSACKAMDWCGQPGPIRKSPGRCG